MKDYYDLKQEEMDEMRSDMLLESKYDRLIIGKDKNSCIVDVYDVLKAFKVTNSALQHLIKKALCVGIRGHKDASEDLQDIIDSAIRAKQLEE